MKKFLPKISKNPQGFTLIELMIVIAIIAVLATVAVVIYQNYVPSARNARRRADIKAIQSAAEANYSSANSNYPFSNAANWFPSGKPTDPDGTAYATWPTVDSATYTICATLQAPDSGTVCAKNQRTSTNWSP